jgi:hypothetical protein
MNLESNVAATAAVLDRTLPGWEDYVNPHTLNMFSNNRCVLGQLANTMPAAKTLISRCADSNTIYAYWLLEYRHRGRTGFLTLAPALCWADRKFEPSTAVFCTDEAGRCWKREIETRRASHVDRILDELLAKAVPLPSPVAYPVWESPLALVGAVA